MVTRQRIGRAVTFAAFCFAAYWIIEDLWNGIGVDRFGPNLFFAAMFGVLYFFLDWWRGRRAASRGDQGQMPPASLGGTLRRINAIVGKGNGASG